MEEKNIGRLVELIKIGGYLIAGGALAGFSVGIYLLFDRAIFGYVIQIAELEILSFFLSVFMPSFIILIVIGYLLATTSGLKRTNLSTVTPLCVLSLLSIVLSVLSIFYFISFLGGFLTLVVLIRAYAKPMFNSLSPNLAFFFVEFGAMFVASFSMLFFLMWAVSNFFVTYAMGFFGRYSPVALLLIGVLSFVMFFVIPLWGRRGTNLGLSGVVGSVILFLTYLFAIQSQYVIFNASAYIGMSLLIVGFALVLVGNLMYFRLFFAVPEAPVAPVTSSLLQGKYCPYCGKPRATAVQSLCSGCGRSLMWTPYAPFCSACGRLIPSDIQACPHCREDIGNKRVLFDLSVAKEQVVARKLVVESKKKPSWITSGLSSVLRPLRFVQRTILHVGGFLSAVVDRANLTLKEAVIIIILTYVFGFVAFIGYVRVEFSQLQNWQLVILNYGFPLEWLQIHSLPKPMFWVRDVVILPVSLTLDIIIYFSGAFLLVYAIQRLRR